MKRIGLALTLALVVGLPLWPGAGWAHHRHNRVFVGCCVFIAPGHPVVIHEFPGHSHFFIHHGFIQRHSTFIVVDPATQPAWVPGFWQWTGVQWAWVPGHWVVPGKGLSLRNPCD